MMKELEKKSQPGPTSFACHIIQCILFVIIALLAVMPLVYHLGTHQAHRDIPHSLDQIFQQDDQTNITKKLAKKGYKYTLLYGPSDSGVFEYLDHYADARAEKGKTVLVRTNSNQAIDVAFKLVRQTKNYLEESLNIEQDQKKSQWIFIIKDGEIPIAQISSIINKHPTHRILIGSVEKVKIEGFKTLKYSPLTIAQLQQIITKQFEIPEEQSEILVNFYGSVPQIFLHLDHITYSHQEHLGMHYFDVQTLNKTQKKVLQTLCTEGVAVVKKNSPDFIRAGVVVFQNQAYWVDKMSRLNYQLKKLVNCEDTTATDQILNKIAEQSTQEKQEKKVQKDKIKKKKKVSKR